MRDDYVRAVITRRAGLLGGLPMGKLAIGCGLSLVIGASCRWIDIPLPSPPKLQGALLVVAMTLGYLGTDWIIAKKVPSKGPATTRALCGGPTGLPTTRNTPSAQ